jgi:hypothetical protein
MDTTQPDDGDERLAGERDLLVGADAIRAHLVHIGWPEPDPYYLKRRGWPIGKSAPGKGGKLVASKNKLNRHTQKLTAPAS